jgi:hypothetical protein
MEYRPDRNGVNTVRSRMLQLCLLLGCTLAIAADAHPQTSLLDPSMEGLRKSLEKLSSAVATSISGRTIFILESPVLPVDPTLDPNQALGRQTIAFMLNRAPRGDVMASYSTETIPSVYKTILQYRDVPKTPFNFLDIWKRARASQILYRPIPWWNVFLGRLSDRERTPEYSQYLDYAKRRAVLVRSSPTDAEVKAFDIDWRTAGFKDRIEGAQNAIQHLSFPFSDSWWRDVQEKYDVTVENMSGDSFPSTFVSPSYGTWITESGWEAFTFEGPSAEKLSVQMEVKLIQIYRPWLEPQVFTNRAWRWQQSSPIQQSLSSGFSQNGDLPQGIMPLLPQSLVLGRKIHVTGSLSQQLKSKWIIPMNDDAAIIGWFCELVPLTPNPDPQYQWTGN